MTWTRLISTQHRQQLRLVSSRMTSSRASLAQEFQVPVPWGVIAGKEWGDPNGKPWIVLHGWLDNCGSFDTLAPIFPKDQRLLCIDYPGHGFSSPIPDGFSYQFLDGLQHVRRVAKHFELSKFSLMGHSMGGGISALFSATYPEMVERLILVDSVKPVTRPRDRIIERTKLSIEELLTFEDKMSSGKAPLYTYNQAKERLIQGSFQLHGKEVITDESADILLKRGLKRVRDGTEIDACFTFTRDIRHRVTSLYSLTQEVIEDFASRITCPFLLIKATGGRGYEDPKNLTDVIAKYKSNPDFVYNEVEGTHHVHLNEPQKVVQPIQSFLERYSGQTSNQTTGSKM